MASKKFDKESSEWKMFADYWKLCQKYWEPEDDDDYWDDVLRSADDFIKIHNCEFAKMLSITLINYLEKEFHKKK